MSRLRSIKPFLSHTAFGKSADKSSLLRSALANERAKTSNWGNNDLMTCFLCLAIKGNVALSVCLLLICNHLVPSSFQSASRYICNEVFVHRNGCSLQESHHLNTFHPTWPPMSACGTQSYSHGCVIKTHQQLK